MLLGIDVATTQGPNFEFQTAWDMGFRVCYPKLGGDNAGRYVAPHYIQQVDKARSIGFRMGHYWVPNANKDILSGADFCVANLRNFGPNDFIVCDNETFPGQNLMLNDEQTAAWIERVKSHDIPVQQIIIYLGLDAARTRQWPKTLATGVNFLIAAYGYAPFTFSFSSIPADRIVGHQYSSSGKIGGFTPVDLNQFRASAFSYTPAPVPEEEEPDMIIIQTPTRGFYTLAPGAVVSLPDDEIIKSIKAGFWPKAPPVWQVADIDLERYVFTFAGLKGTVPGVGDSWFASSQQLSEDELKEYVANALKDLKLTLPSLTVTSTVQPA